MTSNWEKMTAIGSVLSSIAIIIVGVQLFQTEQSIDLQKKSLSDTEKEQSLHLRPWIGIDKSTGGMSYVVLANGTSYTKDHLDQILYPHPELLNQLDIDSVHYFITLKNFGSTPAENVTTRFNWVNDRQPTLNDLPPISISFHEILMPGEEVSFNSEIPASTFLTDTEMGTYTNFIIEIDYDYNNGHGFYLLTGYISPNNIRYGNETGG